jgi:hypothetical protein
MEHAEGKMDIHVVFFGAIVVAKRVNVEVMKETVELDGKSGPI